MANKQSTSGPVSKKRKVDKRETNSKNSEEEQLPTKQQLSTDVQNLIKINKKYRLELVDSNHALKQVITEMITPSFPRSSRPKKGQRIQPVYVPERDLLVECVYTNNLNAMRLLIMHKDKFNSVKLMGYDEETYFSGIFDNPVYAAATLGNYECAELLLEEGGLHHRVKR